MIASLLSFLVLAPKVQYDLWVADPSWVREPLVRKRVEGTLNSLVSQDGPWIRALTEDGRIFNAAPAGFWSEGRFEPLYLSKEDPDGAIGLTFLLPDGRFTTGGAARLNGLEDFSHGVLGGRIYRGDTYEEFADRCFATAVSPSGLLAGVMDDGDWQRHQYELGECGNPCRIVNMRAVPLRFDSMGRRTTPTPIAINDQGVILAYWDGKVGEIKPQTLVWEPNGSYWFTGERIKSPGSTITFACLTNDGRFGGSRHHFERVNNKSFDIEQAIISDGKTYQQLPEAPGIKESCVTHIVGDDFYGWAKDHVRRNPPEVGCTWRSGKMVLLQSLLAKKSDWNIGKVGAVNKRGQIAVWLWKVPDPGSPKDVQRCFGLMTPRR
jgi:hypothetical protein